MWEKTHRLVEYEKRFEHVLKSTPISSERAYRTNTYKRVNGYLRRSGQNEESKVVMEETPVLLGGSSGQTSVSIHTLPPEILMMVIKTFAAMFHFKNAL